MKIEIDISAYKKMIKEEIYWAKGLADLKINVGRRIPRYMVKKGFKEINEFLREFNKENPKYMFDEDLIDLDHTNIPSEIEIKWIYPKEELELLYELANEGKKLFNLKKTEIIIDPNLGHGYCELDKEIIRLYAMNEDEIIHEMVHAYFEERHRILLKQLGPEQYQSKIENIVPDKHLEDVTARLIQYNLEKNILKTCPEEHQAKTKKFVESEEMLAESRKYYGIKREYEKMLGKKIFRLYTSIYSFDCICPKDAEFYKSIKKDIDPKIVYNKLAKYVGTHELI